MAYILIIIQYLMEGVKHLSVLLKRKFREVVRRAKKVRGITIWENLFYHDGHTWLSPVSSKVVKLGIDDFAVKLLGDIEKIQLPSINSKVKKNESLLKIFSGRSRFKLKSAISGEIVEVNSAVQRDPKLILRDPYGAGWIAKIRIENDGVNQLIKGNDAERWFMKEWDRLHYLLTEEAGLTFADGGEITTKELKKVDGIKWEKIVKEFLKC